MTIEVWKERRLPTERTAVEVVVTARHTWQVYVWIRTTGRVIYFRQGRQSTNWGALRKAGKQYRKALAWNWDTQATELERVEAVSRALDNSGWPW